MAKADEARERRRLIAKYDVTGNESYLRAALWFERGTECLDKADILLAEGPRRRGMPEIDDGDWLIEMAALTILEGLSANAAAWRIQPLATPGNSRYATKSRLYRKFKDDPAKYIDLARFVHSNRIRAAQRRARHVAQKSNNK
jgi:hypothetical protein